MGGKVGLSCRLVGLGVVEAKIEKEVETTAKAKTKSRCSAYGEG